MNFVEHVHSLMLEARGEDYATTASLVGGLTLESWQLVLVAALIQCLAFARAMAERYVRRRYPILPPDQRELVRPVVSDIIPADEQDRANLPPLRPGFRVDGTRYQEPDR